MHLTNFIKGIFIGIAFVIPGLSGSVFAVVTGLYDKIIFSINNIKKDFVKQFVFLAPILLGILIGILVSTKIILYLCVEFPIFSYAFFIGLVAGSIPFILKKIPNVKIDFKSIMLFSLSLVLILILGNFDKEQNTTSVSIEKIKSLGDIAILFFAGAFSCSLMTIPGVSGSVLLMVINQYGTVYNAVSKISDFIVNLLKGDFSVMAENLQAIFIIIPFGIGAFIGIIFIAKILGFLLEKYEEELYTCVVGVVFASAITLFQKGILANFFMAGTGLAFIVTMLVAAVLSILGYYVSKLC